MAADIGDDGDLDSILEAVDVEIEDDDVAQNDIVSGDLKTKKKERKSKINLKQKKILIKSLTIMKSAKNLDLVLKVIQQEEIKLSMLLISFKHIFDAYLDLNNPEDIEMFKKWGLYNTKLLLDKYETELENNPDEPNIEDPT